MRILKSLGLCFFIVFTTVILNGMKVERPLGRVKPSLGKQVWYFVPRSGLIGTCQTNQEEIKSKINLLKEIAKKEGLDKPGSNILMLLYLQHTAVQKGGQLSISHQSATEEDVNKWWGALEEKGLVRKGYLDSVVKHLLIVSEGMPHWLDWDYLIKTRRLLDVDQGKKLLTREAKKKQESETDGDLWFFELPLNRTDSLRVKKETIRSAYSGMKDLNKEEFSYLISLITIGKIMPEDENLQIKQALIDKGLLAKDGTPRILVEFLYDCAMQPLSKMMVKKVRSVGEMFLPLSEVLGHKIYKKGD